MRHLLGPAALLLAVATAGCGYYPVLPDPIRYVTSPSEVTGCRGLGHVGLARTDGQGGFSFNAVTEIVPPWAAGDVTYADPTPPSYEIVGENFAVRLNAMRDLALSRGATDLLLRRRVYRDWSYVEGTAYMCRR